MPEETVQTGISDSAACGLAYLTFIPAIIFLVVAPYNANREIRFHSWQSIFLGAFAVVCWVLNMILLFIPIIGWLISIVIMLGLLALWLMCIIKAFSGGRFMIPVLGQLAAKQAGV